MSKHLKAISLGSMALLATGGVIWSIWHLRENKAVRTDDSRIEAMIVPVGCKLSDRITEIKVREGDHVTKGQTLALLDSRSIEARKLTAESKAALMKARYDEVMAGSRPHDIEEQKARVAQAEATLERTRRDYERIENLVKQDAGISQADRDAAEATYLAAQASVKAERENLELKIEGSREEEKRSAHAQWQSALAELQDLDILHEECVIKSPVSGMVAQKLVSEGELVSSGQKLFSIVDEDDMWLNVRIEETKIGRISVGQNVLFSIDGYPGRKFEGKITEIGAATSSTFTLLSTENISGYFTKVMQRIPIKVSLPRDADGIVFRPGMQGEAHINL